MLSPRATDYTRRLGLYWLCHQAVEIPRVSQKPTITGLQTEPELASSQVVRAVLPELNLWAFTTEVSLTLP